MTGLRIDECEQACSELDLCERFAYGRENTAALKTCILIKNGCLLGPSNDYNLFKPKIGVIEIPSSTKDVCTHLDLFQKQQPVIDKCKGYNPDKNLCKLNGYDKRV